MSHVEQSKTDMGVDQKRPLVSYFVVVFFVICIVFEYNISVTSVVKILQSKGIFTQGLNDQIEFISTQGTEKEFIY